MIFLSRNHRFLVFTALTMCFLLLAGCSAAPLSLIARASTIPAETPSIGNQSNPDKSDDLKQGSEGTNSKELENNPGSKPETTPDTTKVAGDSVSNPDNPDQGNNLNKDNTPLPQPDSPGTPIHPYYQMNGNPPTAPGLAMRKRLFAKEPEKIAYLTFDDGPYPQTTPRLLKILREKNVHATFFVIGRQVQKYPELVKAEFDQGNAIGNHTFSHNYAQCYRSPDAFLADIKKNEDLIYQAVGIRPRIIRAPGGTEGHFHVNYFNAIDAGNYLVYDWNVSTGDATSNLVPTAQLIANIKRQVQNRKRIIILMHDIGNKVTTVEALPEIIDYLKQQGYSFGILSPQVAPIIFPGGFHG